MREDARADRVERNGRCGGIVDDFDRKHEWIRPLTKLFVKSQSIKLYDPVLPSASMPFDARFAISNEEVLEAFA